MVEITQITPGQVGPARQVPLLLGRTLTLFWPWADALVVVALSVMAGIAYHMVVYGGAGSVLDFAKVGAAVALFRWILQTPRLDHFLSAQGLVALSVLSVECRVSLPARLRLSRQDLGHLFPRHHPALLCLRPAASDHVAGDVEAPGAPGAVYRAVLPCATGCCWVRSPRSMSSGGNTAPASPA